LQSENLASIEDMSESGPVLPNPSPRTQMSPQALGANQFGLMPSHSNNFINFTRSTFLFVQRLNAPNHREKLKNLLFHQALYFEELWQQLKCKLVI